MSAKIDDNSDLDHFERTCEYLKPKVETMPPVQPIKSAPNGLTGIEAHAEIAVPPAKVAF